MGDYWSWDNFLAASLDTVLITVVQCFSGSGLWTTGGP